MPRPQQRERLCIAELALRQSLRPNANQKVALRICKSPCICCDIWRLSTLVATHVPFSHRYSGSPFYTSNRLSTEFQQIEKRISSQFQTQRVQLFAMISMITNPHSEIDAIRSPGLRKAYARCFSAIQQLLCEEADLEDRCIRPYTTSMSRRTSRDANYAVDSSSYYSYERETSRVSLAV